MKPSYAIAAICATAFWISWSNAELVILHSQNTDPITEGWGQQAGSGTFTGPVNDGGILAWSVDDSSLAAGSFNVYTHNPTSQQALNANTNGWTLSMDLRVVNVPDAVDGSIWGEYRNGSTRFIMTFGSEADGDPIVSLVSSGSSFTLQNAGSTYHLYELKFDPLTGTADLFVNGIERLSDYGGIPGAFPANVVWGSAQSGSTGKAYYRSVQFSTVPEPSALAMFSCGFLFTISFNRRKRSQNS